MSNDSKDSVYEISFFVKRHMNKWVNNFMTDSDRRALIKISMTAYILYEYYLQNYDPRDLLESLGALEDKEAGYILGWPERKVANARRALVSNNWLYQVKGRMNDGRKVIGVYLGQDKVLAAKEQIK